MFGFLLLLFLTRGKKESRLSLALKILSSLIWFLLVLNLAAVILGSLAPPLVVLLFVSAAILSVTGKKEKKLKKRGKSETDPEGSGGDDNNIEDPYSKLTALSSISASSLFEDADTANVDTQIEGVYDEATGSKVSKSGKVGTSGFNKDDAGKIGSKEGEEEEEGDDLYEVPSSVSFGSIESIPLRVGTSKDDSAKIPRGSKMREGMGAGHRRMEDRRSTRLKATQVKMQRAREHSNLVFMVLILAYFIVITCKYPLIMFLLSPLALWALLRRAFSLSPPLEPFMRKVVNAAGGVWGEMSWLITPPPLPTLMRMYIYADRTILKLAVQTTGSLVSCFIIIGLVVGVVMGVVALLLQVQVELAHYMTVGAKVWNMTLTRNPQLSE